MKTLMVMFDSLNLRTLPPYGCDWVHAPNFTRLAEHTVVFDRAYVGSMPCMPARRELHTGRYNFLHRSWGPLEPFDDSMPELLKKGGVYTHLVSDHPHYWEDGGCTYHPRYNSWEISRGQEGDPWKGMVREPDVPDHLGELWRQDVVNRSHLTTVESQPQARTFAGGLEFLETNHADDRWFLQIETFDPHEPFYTQREFKDLYPHDYHGPQFDWPSYRSVTETEEQVQHLRYEYAALVSMCDRQLGLVLDAMDRYDLWSDTMLIVNTDHGFLLGEHGLWAKTVHPYYNEVAHMPLFIWDPRSGKKGERRNALVQTIDLPATILDYFGFPLPEDMQGRPLARTIVDDTPVRDGCLFGSHGGHVNYTDGRYVYMRAPREAENQPLYDYTVMPTHMRSMFSVEELATTELAPPLSFTKGVPVMKIKTASTRMDAYSAGTMIFDLENDPEENHPVQDRELENRLAREMVALMEANDCPPEQYERLGLNR